MSSGFQRSDSHSTKLSSVNGAHILQYESTPNHTKLAQATARTTGKLTLQLVKYMLANLLSGQFC